MLMSVRQYVLNYVLALTQDCNLKELWFRLPALNCFKRLLHIRTWIIIEVSFGRRLLMRYCIPTRFVRRCRCQNRLPI